MTIHLLRAPDYVPTDYFAVCDLLLAMNLPGWRFIVPEVEIDPESIYPDWGGSRRRPEDVNFRYRSPVEKIMYDPTRTAPLSWRELFDVCTYYRQLGDVDSEAVVVLLTRRPNALNWFSAFDQHRNVFVHTDDWERFILCEAKYPIAYQVLSNTLQLQLVGRLGLLHKEACMHDESIGCMNDFCEHKGQIALKLRTGDICIDCLDKLKAAEVPDRVVQGALDGFDQLRRQMLFRQGFRPHQAPATLVVNQHYRLIVPEQGNLELKMSAMQRTVYIFFLKHAEGIRLAELSNYRDELLALYERISGSGSKETMRSSIDRLVDARENALHENRAKIQRAIIDILGQTLAQPYLIRGTAGDRYRVGLDPARIQFNLNSHL